jgi:hypothetical protein
MKTEPTFCTLRKSILGRVDGFDQDEAESKRDEQGATRTCLAIHAAPTNDCDAYVDQRELTCVVA